MPKSDSTVFEGGDGNRACGPLARALYQQESAGILQKMCLVDEACDADTISRLFHVLKGLDVDGGEPPVILANIRDTVLRQAVEMRLEMDHIIPRPCIVSSDSLVASHFIATNPLFKLALLRDQPQVHVALVGFGALGRAFLDEILLDSMAAGLGNPVIDILAADVQGVQAALRHQMPEIGLSASLQVSRFCLDDAGQSLIQWLAQAEQTAPLTAIFLVLDSPAETLMASAIIGDYQDRSGLALATLFIGGAAADEAVALVTPRRPANNLARQIKVIGNLASIPDLLAQIWVGRDIVARRMHNAYQTAFGQDSAAGVSWDLLSETYRRANRRAARNLAQKLWALGIFASENTANTPAVSPSTFEKVITPLVASSVENSVMRSLARLEHERWCMDRRLDGWKHGERRDDRRRLHPSLIAFDDPRLSAGEIEKDISQLRFLLDSVIAPHEAGAAVHFTIGVLEDAAQAQPGIDLSALVERVTKETDREIVVISPVLTAPELAAATSLINLLGAQNRRFQFFLPECGLNDQTMRNAEVVADPDFAALLALSQTYIVPISSPAWPSDDGWEDILAGNEKHDALKNYVLRRADALLATQPMRVFFK